MNQEVANLVHYQQQVLACNRRYLDALAVVDDPTPAYQELRQLTEPKVVAGRSFAGFNPARREDVRVFAAVLDGDHIARGFRNKDLRATLFDSETKSSPRQSAAVGRLLKRLHVLPLMPKSRAPGVGALRIMAAICSAGPYSYNTKAGLNWLPHNTNTISASCIEVYK